ncbi:MAG: hypothetical protein J1E80_03685 [Desulfovibrionaceae bacterium]|nr:hypothetical protein [Desulfovibrionaceae bacterium]
MPTVFRVFRILPALILPSALLGCVLAAGCVSPLSSLTPAESPPGDEARTEAWIRGLEGLSPLEQARIAEQAWRDEANPPLLRDRAAVLLSTRPSSQYTAAQQALAQRYNAAPPEERAAMEHTLMADLASTDDNTLRLLGSAAARGSETSFPWSLTVLQAAKRGLLADSAATLQRLSSPGIFADPGVAGLSAQAIPPAESPAGPRSGCVALLLPQSGPFASISRQIADGAAVAAQTLSGQGTLMDLRIVDCSQPDWLDQVAALPPQCAAVGGPLQADDYGSLRARGLPGRALFAFLPQLPNPADEGNDVWRFFTSPQDQVDAVLDVAVNELGVLSFGALVPGDSYGKRMGDLFLQAATRRGLPVSTTSYPPKDMKAWTRLTATFVKAVAPEKGKIPHAGASFEAIFLPDGWKNMDMLISALHYNGARTKIMLGSALWEQSLASAHKIQPSTFALTIFPGVWDAQAMTPAASALRDGMAARGGQCGNWAVLGYDFVQLAASLGLDSPQWIPAGLNARLAAGSVADWAGAPMRWDGAGRASRRLILFQPTATGMKRLDLEAFQSYRQGRGPLPNLEPAEQGSAASEPDISALIESIVGKAAQTAADPAPAELPHP